MNRGWLGFLLAVCAVNVWAETAADSASLLNSPLSYFGSFQIGFSQAASLATSDNVSLGLPAPSVYEAGSSTASAVNYSLSIGVQKNLWTRWQFFTGLALEKTGSRDVNGQMTILDGAPDYSYHYTVSANDISLFSGLLYPLTSQWLAGASLSLGYASVSNQNFSYTPLKTENAPMDAFSNKTTNNISYGFRAFARYIINSRFDIEAGLGYENLGQSSLGDSSGSLGNLKTNALTQTLVYSGIVYHFA